MAKRKPRTRNHGTMTESQYMGMIMSALRKRSMFWKPVQECKKAARVSRGKYLCALCGSIVSNKEAKIDHIEPVKPLDGHDSWDGVTDRLFCEIDGLQLLCSTCHDKKTKHENAERRKRKK